MRIDLPTLTEEGGKAILTSMITSADGQRELWFALPAAQRDWFAIDRCNGFVVGLLLQAMERNEDIFTEAPISSRLWHNLSQFYIPMMAQAFPNLHPIKILAPKLTHEAAPGRGVVTGFSGGIDSFATVVQHFIQEKSPDHRISHFLFHNVGSHGHGTAEDSRKLFWQRYEQALPFAREVGIPMVPVDSNLAEILPIDFIQMHPALNASIPLVLQNQFQRYYYASAYKYADCGVNLTDDVARFDPLAFHLFSTEGLDCVSTGCQMSRVEKTRLVATYEPSHRYLNVCVDPAFEGRNCSVCFKCCRTLLTLELLGEAHHYQDIFDFEKFSKVRSKYLRKVLHYKRSSFEAEIADLAREKEKGTTGWLFAARHLWDRLRFGC